MDRLAMLEKMVAAKPDDPFPKYGRAMELKKLGRNDEARAASGLDAERWDRARAEDQESVEQDVECVRAQCDPQRRAHVLPSAQGAEGDHRNQHRGRGQ